MKFRFTIMTLMVMFIFAACCKDDDPTPDYQLNNDVTTSVTPDVLEGYYFADDLDNFTVWFTWWIESGDVDPSDEDYEENSTFGKVISITFDDTSGATVTGDVNGYVSVNGNKVTVNNTGNDLISYELSGNTTNGYFKLYSDVKQRIIINSLSLTNPSGAAINVQSKERTFIRVDGTDASSLGDGSTYTDIVNGERMDACCYSEGRIVFSGSCKLEITSNYKAGIRSEDIVRFLPGSYVYIEANNGDAIQSKKALISTGGVIQAMVHGKGGKGINTDGYVHINRGPISIHTRGDSEYDSKTGDYKISTGIKAGGDIITNDFVYIGIQCSGLGNIGIDCGGNLTIKDGSYKIRTDEDALEGDNYTILPIAIKVGGNINVEGGLAKVCSRGGYRCIGIECNGDFNINVGTVEVYGRWNAINTGGDMTVNSGILYAHGFNDDGIKVGKTFHINGGVVVAIGGPSTLCGINAKKSVYLNGGTTVITGGSFPTLSPSSKQANIAFQARRETHIGLIDGTKAILHYRISPMTYVDHSVIISSPELKKRHSYTLREWCDVTHKPKGTCLYFLYTGSNISAGKDNVMVKAAIAATTPMATLGYSTTPN